MDIENWGNFRVLIVDDTLSNIQVLGNILTTNSDYAIEFATGGRQALEWVENQDFDLILLDLMMPQMDGFEVCARLKSDPRTARIPVLFLTARNETESLVRAFELGAADYVTKPFQTAELMARVRTQLTLKRGQDEREALIRRLEIALSKVKQLSGLLPICANCKKIRDDTGYWSRVEEYIAKHSEAEFSHGICPDCMQILYGDVLKGI
ncbi:MAG: response regulator [Spirochaetaceae bacterium]|nr:MAG: response regulator [Spirochaetaceae bacterium]